MKILIAVLIVSLSFSCQGNEDDEANKTNSKERTLNLGIPESKVGSEKNHPKNSTDGYRHETQTVQALEEKIDQVHVEETTPEKPEEPENEPNNDKHTKEDKSDKEDVTVEYYYDYDYDNNNDAGEQSDSTDDQTSVEEKETVEVPADEGSGDGIGSNLETQNKTSEEKLSFLVEESGEEKIISGSEEKKTLELSDDKESSENNEEDDRVEIIDETIKQEIEVLEAESSSNENSVRKADTLPYRGPTPKALFYCFNTAAHGRYVHVRIDPNGIGYRDVYGITSDGQRAVGCSRDAFDVSDGGVMSLTIASDNGRFDPNCGAEEEEENVFSWRVRFQEIPALESANDVIFTLRCNFSNGEPLWRGANPTTANGHVRNLELESASEDVRLDILDSESKKPINEAVLGQDVKLQMALHAQHDLSASGISPFSCTAHSPDGRQSIGLTDLHGCPNEASPLTPLTGDGTAVETRSFRIFKFPGIDDVILKCYFDYCFDNDNLKCEDRCKYFNIHTDRRKRAVASKKPNYAFKSIRVFADADKYALAESRQHNSNTIIRETATPAYMIAMMGILFLLLLCSVCAVLFLYIRLKEARRRNACPVPTAGDDDMSVIMDWGDETEKL